MIALIALTAGAAYAALGGVALRVLSARLSRSAR